MLIRAGNLPPSVIPAMGHSASFPNAIQCKIVLHVISKEGCMGESGTELCIKGTVQGERLGSTPSPPHVNSKKEAMLLKQSEVIFYFMF